MPAAPSASTTTSTTATRPRPASTTSRAGSRPAPAAAGFWAAGRRPGIRSWPSGARTRVWEQVTVRLQADGVAWLESSYRPVRGQRRLDVSNRLEKIATDEKESVFFAFPLRSTSPSSLRDHRRGRRDRRAARARLGRPHARRPALGRARRRLCGGRLGDARGAARPGREPAPALRAVPGDRRPRRGRPGDALLLGDEQRLGHELPLPAGRRDDASATRSRPRRRRAGAATSVSTTAASARRSFARHLRGGLAAGGRQLLRRSTATTSSSSPSTLRSRARSRRSSCSRYARDPSRSGPVPGLRVERAFAGTFLERDCARSAAAAVAAPPAALRVRGACPRPAGWRDACRVAPAAALWGPRVREYDVAGGLRAVFLENELLRVGVLADRGSDVFELLYKPRDLDFAWLATERRPRRPRVHARLRGAVSGHLSRRLAGGLAERRRPLVVRGRPLRAARRDQPSPRDSDVVEDAEQAVAVRFTVTARKSPLRLVKQLRLAAGEPSLHDRRDADERERRCRCTLMWGHHIAFGPPFLEPGCRVRLPDAVEAIPHADPLNDGGRRVRAGRFRWPRGDATPTGSGGRDRRASPTRGAPSELLYLTGFPEGRYEILRAAEQLGLRVELGRNGRCRTSGSGRSSGASDRLPRYGRHYNVGLEPSPSYPTNGLAEAVANGYGARVAAARAARLLAHARRSSSQDFAGKVAVVTGGSLGMGVPACGELCRRRGAPSSSAATTTDLRRSTLWRELRGDGSLSRGTRRADVRSASPRCEAPRPARGRAATAASTCSSTRRGAALRRTSSIRAEDVLGRGARGEPQGPVPGRRVMPSRRCVVAAAARSSRSRPSRRLPRRRASRRTPRARGRRRACRRSMAVDHAAEGITVNAVCPGSVDTPMLRWAAERFREGGASEEVVDERGQGHPLGRVIRPTKSPSWSPSSPATAPPSSPAARYGSTAACSPGSGSPSPRRPERSFGPAERRRSQDLRATTVTVPLEAPLRHCNGAHWGRFVRTIVEVETDDGLLGLGELGGGGESGGGGVHGAEALPRRPRPLRASRRCASRSATRPPASTTTAPSCTPRSSSPAWTSSGRKLGVPVYDLLGGQAAGSRSPSRRYLFFRYPDRDTGRARSGPPDQLVAHARALKQQHGFTLAQAQGRRLSARTTSWSASGRWPTAFPGDRVALRPQRASVASSRRSGSGRRSRTCDNDYFEDPDLGLQRHAPRARGGRASRSPPTPSSSTSSSSRRTCSTPRWT